MGVRITLNAWDLACLTLDQVCVIWIHFFNWLQIVCRLNLHHIELFITTCTTQILRPFTVNRSTVLATLHKFKKKVCLLNHAQYTRVTNRTVIKKTLKVVMATCKSWLPAKVSRWFVIGLFFVDKFRFPPYCYGKHGNLPFRSLHRDINCRLCSAFGRDKWKLQNATTSHFGSPKFTGN